MLTYNWRQLSMIQIGSVICLPIIMVGQILCQTYGFASAIAAILAGNLVLFFFGLVSAKMSYEKRKTTPENAFEYFGEKGVVLFALTMGLSLLGWFAIQINMMSLGVVDLLSLEPANPMVQCTLNICMGALITLVGFFGLRALNLFADLSVPLLILTLLYALWTQQGEAKEQVAYSNFSFGGISLVIAVIIGHIFDLPTYFCQARSPRDTWISILIIFGLTLPMIEISGVYLTYKGSGHTILEVLKGENSPIWNAWVAVFLVLSGWATNNLNLYSGIVCLESLF